MRSTRVTYGYSRVIYVTGASDIPSKCVVKYRLEVIHPLPPFTKMSGRRATINENATPLSSVPTYVSPPQHPRQASARSHMVTRAPPVLHGEKS